MITFYYCGRTKCTEQLRGCQEGSNRRYCFRGCSEFEICVFRCKLPTMQQMADYIKANVDCGYSIKETYCTPCRREIQGLPRYPLKPIKF